MKFKYYGLLTLLCLATTMAAQAATFSRDASYSICFTPGQDCTELVVQTLAAAQRTVEVQAYSFTSAPIAKALVKAEQRGVEVKVILDKSQQKAGYSSSRYLVNQGIPVWIDYQPAIAHNKVMIIDHNTVITGSFNFTKAAQEKNAENLLVIHDAGLAEKYLVNWNKRQAVSRAIAENDLATERDKSKPAEQKTPNLSEMWEQFKQAVQ